MTKLYNIPKGSKIRIEIQTSSFDEHEKRMATFHHIDGLYSLCTMDGEKKDNFHLYANTDMKLVDGAYEIDEDLNSPSSSKAEGGE